MVYALIFIFLIILKIFLIYLLRITNEENNKQLLTCFTKRWGCCEDNYTPKLDIFGSNLEDLIILYKLLLIKICYNSSTHVIIP